jgi:hypothetical protein
MWRRSSKRSSGDADGAGNVIGRKAAYNRCDYQTYGSHQDTAGPCE